MPELCLFCDNDSGSREHLWPKWIHERKDIGPLRLQVGNSAEKVVPNPEQKVLASDWVGERLRLGVA